MDHFCPKRLCGTTEISFLSGKMSLFNINIISKINVNLDFQTEARFDKVKVYEIKPGLYQTSFGVFSGESIPEKITSTRNQLFVQFTSDNNHRDNYYGFEAIFNAVKSNL